MRLNTTRQCVHRFSFPIKGRFEEAYKSLEWLRGKRPISGRRELDSELERLKKSLFKPEEKGAQKKGVAGSYWAQLSRPEVWKPLVLVVVIFFLQQFSGMSVITYYAVNAIKDAGSSVDAVHWVVQLNFTGNGSILYAF